MYNAEKTIKQCIESLIDQDFDGRYEILVVDNGSTDNSLEIVKRYPSVKLLFESKKGPAAARNKGISYAKGELIAFTDSDCEVEKNWLEKFFKYIEDNPEIAAIGGGVVNPYPRDIIAIASEITDFGEQVSSDKNYLRYTYAVPTNNICYRREILEEVGYFDEDFELTGGEDISLNWKIIKRGYRILFNPDIKVIHYHRSNLKALFNKKIISGQSFYKSRIKDPSLPYSYLCKSLALSPIIYFAKSLSDIRKVYKYSGINISRILALSIVLFTNFWFLKGVFKEYFDVRK